MTTVSAELKSEVKSKILNGLLNYTEVFPSTKPILDFPVIDYSLRGHTAGVAHLQQNKMRLNADLLTRYGTEFINDTPLHELAHLIEFKLYGSSSHGPRWKDIMRTLGQAPDRTHNFDTVAAKTTRKFHYVCDKCHTELTLGTTQHKRAQRGKNYRHRCGGAITFIKQKTSAPTPTVHSNRKPPAKKANNSGRMSKKQLVNTLLSVNLSLTRAESIALIVKNIGMSEAGASTYYYNFKKGK